MLLYCVFLKHHWDLQENYPSFRDPWNNEYCDPDHGYHAGLWGMQILGLGCFHLTWFLGHWLIKLYIAGRTPAKKETAALRDFCCLERDLKKEEKSSESIEIFGTVDKETVSSMEIASNTLRLKDSYIVMYISAPFFNFFNFLFQTLISGAVVEQLDFLRITETEE